jgi:hypothetical protein
MSASLWGDGVTDMMRAIPRRELPLLISPDPGLRAFLASDAACSHPAMLLLADDVDRVRRALALNPAAPVRLLELRVVGELVRNPWQYRTDVQNALRRNPNLDRELWDLIPPNPNRWAQMHSFVQRRARPELLRLMWRSTRDRPALLTLDHLPVDLLVAGLADPGHGVRSEALRHLARREAVDGAGLAWEVVRAVLAPMGWVERQELLTGLPPRYVEAAAQDSDTAMRLAAVPALQDGECLKALARDADEAVRSLANRRLLDIVGQ